MDQMKTIKYAFICADVLILVAAGFLASKILLSMFLPPIAPGPSSTPTASKKGSLTGVIQEGGTEAILQRNLFGSKVLEAQPAKSKKTEEELASLPESKLPLKLLGTVVQVNGKRSFAVIMDEAAREEQIHFVGDEVRDGAVLTSVARNRVVLVRNGREEILTMEEDQSGKPGQVASSKRKFPVARAASGSSPPEGGSMAVRKVGDNNYVLDRREVNGMLQDFNKLLTQVRVVPHFADGKPDGFKIFNIRPGSLFASLGMVNGDIIKRVNGLDITGPEQALQMFQQLRDENQVTVDLERFRKNLTLQYDIR